LLWQFEKYSHRQTINHQMSHTITILDFLTIVKESEDARRWDYFLFTSPEGKLEKYAITEDFLQRIKGGTILGKLNNKLWYVSDQSTVASVLPDDYERNTTTHTFHSDAHFSKIYLGFYLTLQKKWYDALEEKSTSFLTKDPMEANRRKLYAMAEMSSEMISSIKLRMKTKEFVALLNTKG